MARKPQKLTDTIIRQTRVKSGERIDLSDGGSGLILRVTTKSRAWMWRYRAKGKQRRLELGLYPTMGLAEARAALEMARARVRGGADPALEKRQDNMKVLYGHTVCNMLDAYLALEAEPNNVEKTVKSKRAAFARLPPEFLNDRPENVTFQQLAVLVDAEHRRVLAKGKRGVIANQLASYLRHAFAWGRKKGWIVDNPALGLEGAVKRVARTNHLEDDGIRKLWAALEDNATDLDWQTRLALKLALVTGQRRSEIVNLRWRDVNLIRHLWKQTENKAGRPHLVPLPRLAMELLDEAKKRGFGEYVFASKRSKTGHLDPNSVTQAAARLGRRINVPFTPHSLRRTMTTIMEAEGVTRFVTSRVLNHAEQGVTGQHYSMYQYEAEKRTALETWASYVEQLAGIERPSAENVVTLGERA